MIHIFTHAFFWRRTTPSTLLMQGSVSGRQKATAVGTEAMHLVSQQKKEILSLYLFCAPSFAFSVTYPFNLVKRKLFDHEAEYG